MAALRPLVGLWTAATARRRDRSAACARWIAFGSVTTEHRARACCFSMGVQDATRQRAGPLWLASASLHRTEEDREVDRRGMHH